MSRPCDIGSTPVGIHRLHLVYQFEDAGKFGLNVGNVAGRHGNAGEMRDPLNVLGGETHGSERKPASGAWYPRLNRLKGGR